MNFYLTSLSTIKELPILSATGASASGGEILGYAGAKKFICTAFKVIQAAVAFRSITTVYQSKWAMAAGISLIVTPIAAHLIQRYSKNRSLVMGASLLDIYANVVAKIHNIVLFTIQARQLWIPSIVYSGAVGLAYLDIVNLYNDDSFKCFKGNKTKGNY